MSVRSDVLFEGTGVPSYRLLSLWRAKATGIPLPSAAVLVAANGEATTVFRALWESAQPSGRVLPREAIANRDGTGTDRFWDAFT